LRANQENQSISQNRKQNHADVVTEWVNLRIRDRASDEVEGEVEVGQREECEQEIDELVDELDVQKDLACNAVVGIPDLSEMHK
jgi:hypothetical protein